MRLIIFSGMFLSHTTTSMISCCVARHNICNTCSGVSLSHDTHDKIFGGRKVYLVCAYIWLVTILTLIPDIIRRVKIRQNLILFQFFDAGIWILYFTRVSGYLWNILSHIVPWKDISRILIVYCIGQYSFNISCLYYFIWSL